MSQRSSDTAARIAGRFTLIRRLGDGAEGGAWLARDELEARRVVLKRVAVERRPALAMTLEVLRSAGSPHLPDGLGLHDDGEAIWLATSHVDGGTLDGYRADELGAVRIARGVGLALAALHLAGTHHGDVSPRNVLRTSTGGVVLVDFGQLGQRGCGTPGYLAPESLAGGGGPAADLFALGCLWFSVLFGEPPWRDPGVLARLDEAAVQHRVDSAFTRARAEGTLVPGEATRTLLLRLLTPRPDRRPSIEAVVARAARLEGALGARLAAPSSSEWHVPPRWPWQGPNARALARELAGPSPRVVAVAGPPGSGRDRAVEEIEVALGGMGLTAVRSETLDLDTLERWLEIEHEVLVVERPLGRSCEALIERLAATVTLARRSVVLRCDAGQGDRLAQRLGGACRRVQLEPLGPRHVEHWVRLARDDDDVAPWVAALLDGTGGWAGRLVSALEGAAREGMELPDARRIAVLAGEGSRPSPEVARRRLMARWGLDPGAAVPSAAEVALARLALGERVEPLARAAARELKGPPSLALALDSGEPDILASAVLDAADPVMAELVAQVERAPDNYAPVLRVAAASEALRRGDTARALSLVAHLGDARARIVQARAHQRLGEPERALERLDAAGLADDLEGEALRVRSMIDRGDVEGARARGHGAWQGSCPGAPGRIDLATWTGYAQLSLGDVAGARRRFEAALTELSGAEGPAVEGQRARLHQLLGNAAQAQGDLEDAARHLRLAATHFEGAREPGAAVLVRAGLASLAQAGGRPAEAVELGRRALRGLLVRGQHQSLAAVLVNLVRGLCRSGCAEEARPLLDAVASVADERGALVQARVGRARLEIEVAVEPPSGRLGEALLTCAEALDEAGVPREALDARLRAVDCLRRAGLQERALELLERLEVPTDHRDPELLVDLGVARLGVAGDVLLAGPPALRGRATATQARGLEELGRAGTPDELWSRGARVAAHAYDRALLGLLADRLPVGDARRRRLARRLMERTQAIMSDANELDRDALRRTLLTDGGDPAPLRALLAELDGEGGEPASHGPHLARSSAEVRPPADRPDEHAASLIRIYRRLAREEHLERLLEQVVDAIMELTDAERGAVVVLGGGETEPRLEVVRELAGEGDVSFSRSVIEQVLTGGAPVLSLDAASDERFDGSRSVHHLNLRSVLAIPLRFRGVLLGAAYVDHRLRRGAFDESDLRRVEDFADLAALAVAHARALSRARAHAAAMEEQRARLAQLLEQREVEVVGLREQVRHDPDVRQGYRGLIGRSPEMQALYRLIDRLGDSSVSVVIHGESGTGKELVARAIHEAGLRRERPFVAENCGAIPETLLESVLFGHAKGAFTGAQRARPGLFEAADGGTIFLDEVGEMSPAMQTKLLRVLQEGEVRRVGETAARKVDVRVIAASNRDLERMVARGSFRQDLFYRICVVRIDIPPLRERRSDLPLLVEHFLRRHGAEHLEVSSAAQRRLARYAWPGNVRELENEVQRWGALVEARVQVDDLAPPIRDADAAEVEDPDDLRLKPRVERMERLLIARALARTDGNQTQAAQLLGLSRYGLQKKLKRLEEDGVDLSAVLAG